MWNTATTPSTCGTRRAVQNVFQPTQAPETSARMMPRGSAESKETPSMSAIPPKATANATVFTSPGGSRATVACNTPMMGGKVKKRTAASPTEMYSMAPM